MAVEGSLAAEAGARVDRAASALGEPVGVDEARGVVVEVRGDRGEERRETERTDTEQKANDIDWDDYVELIKFVDNLRKKKAS